jgi:hypothetical protein
MLSGQGKARFIVIERVNGFINIPALRAMTGAAADAEVFTMRGIALLSQSAQYKTQG